MGDSFDTRCGGNRARSIVRLKPRLRLVGKKLVPACDVSKHERRRKLVERASQLFPSLSLRKRWVRAKERLGPTRPLVDIGIERADVSRAMRSCREAGIHLEPKLILPEFIKKLLRLH